MKAGRSPRHPDVVVGCSKAETLASLNRQRPAVEYTKFSSAERLLGAAGEGDKNLAPCWVLKEQPAGCFFGARHDLVTHTVSVSWPGGVVFLGFGGWLLGLWVGRWLRIAQWTRASLFSVVKLSRADGGCLGTRSR